MRKPKQPTQPNSNDDVDALVIAVTALALVAVFGGLAVAYSWKAIVTGVPL